MIWVLLIYVMGMLLTQQCLADSLDYFDDPWVSMMWPILLVAMMADWIKRL